MGRISRSLLWLLAACCCAAPLPAFFAAPVPPSIAAGCALLFGLALWRPLAALLVLAGLGPLATAIEAVSGLSHYGSLLFEFAVLIVLAAAAFRAALQRARLVPTVFDVVALGFIIVALASCVAQLPVVLLRAGVLPSIGAAIDFVPRTFFDRSTVLTPVWQTALLVEGAALAALTARVLRESEHRTAFRTMLIVGGAGAAALNVSRLLEVALRNPPPADTLLRVLGTTRFNVHYGDLNAAGSHFALLAVLAVAATDLRSSRGWMHLSLLALIAAALWVSGSRVAMAATLICSVGVLLARRGALARVGRSTLLAAAAVALAAAFTLTLFYLPGRRHGTVAYSVNTRVEVLAAGVRMFTDRPLFGVGTSQFYARFPHYASPDLMASFEQNLGRRVTNENAHNQFLQILAELGVLGIVPFVLLIGMALAGADLAFRAALAAFLLTCLAGHPLLTPIVAFTFWMAAGAGVAAAPLGSPRRANEARRGVLVLAVLLLATLPARWTSDRQVADLGDVAIGVEPRWERDPDGRRFRRAARHARLFVPSHAGAIRLPLRSGTQELHVRILLDGRPAAGIRVPPDTWVDAKLVMPPSANAPAFRQLDLHVDDGAAEDPGTASPLMVGQLETRG